MRLYRFGLYGLLAGACASCGPAGDATSERARDPWTSGAPGRFAIGAPTLVLHDDGTPERAFVRISARKLPGGDIVVADGASREVRRFGRDGRFVGLLARGGSGPGEIRGDVILALAGDTIFLIPHPSLSPSPSRLIAYIDPRGALLGEVPVPVRGSSLDSSAAGVARTVVVRDRFSTGQFLVQSGTGWRRVMTAFETGALIPDSISLGILSTSDSAEPGDVRWLTPLQHRWLFAFPWIGGPIPTATGTYPFAAATLFVVSSDLLWLGDASAGEVRAMDATGTERIRVSLSLPALAFDAKQMKTVLRAGLQSHSSPQARARIRAMHDARIRPQLQPRFDQLLAGVDGELWVRRFNVDSAGPSTFLVVSRGGSIVGSLTLPPRLAPQQIGADFLLAVQKDDDGVEQVVEYPLRRQE